MSNAKLIDRLERHRQSAERHDAPILEANLRDAITALEAHEWRDIEDALDEWKDGRLVNIALISRSGREIPQVMYFEDGTWKVVGGHPLDTDTWTPTHLKPIDLPKEGPL